jgi:hypothetical protein
MKCHIAQLGLTLALAVMASACSNTPKLSSAERLALFRANAGEPVLSFSLLGGGKFNSWTSLGDEALAVWTRPKQAYLLELTAPCLDLEYATAISISNLGGRVSSGFDSVYIRGGAPNPMRLPCRINKVRPINDTVLRDAEKQLQQQKRTGATAVDREPEPQAPPSQQG